MQKLHQQFSTRSTPQSEAIPGTDQVANSAGGFSWEASRWDRLMRFLVLGTEGGSYYASESALTRENATNLLACVHDDGPRVVRTIVEVSEAGRAPKNDPALFALALASSEGNDETRRAAFDALPRVARIGTHLFHFIEYRKAFGGWGRGMRTAVGLWYLGMDADRLAYQLIKYRQRDGWTHRDVLRLSHPSADGPQHAALLAWAAGKGDSEAHPLIEAFMRVQASDDVGEVAGLIREHRLPREAIPPDMLTSPVVWEAMLDSGMPLTAMIRNLGVMTSRGVLGPGASANATVLAALGNGEAIRKARVHPIQVLAALIAYRNGHGARGSTVWHPVPQIVDALDGAFYTSFGNVEPTGKRTLLALDVSGSMEMGSVSGVPGLTPRVGSAAMALVTAKSEPAYHTVGFSHELIDLPISPRQRLDDVVRTVSGLRFGGTDCALPMLWALENGYAFDTFVVYTDSETWAGRAHPSQALQQYRQKTGIAAKLVVVGMEGNRFTIADPRDPGMLDVVGFDTRTPQAIAEFAR